MSGKKAEQLHIGPEDEFPRSIRETDPELHLSEKGRVVSIRKLIDLDNEIKQLRKDAMEPIAPTINAKKRLADHFERLKFFYAVFHVLAEARVRSLEGDVGEAFVVFATPDLGCCIGTPGEAHGERFMDPEGYHEIARFRGGERIFDEEEHDFGVIEAI